MIKKKKIVVVFMITQRTGDRRFLASIYQQCGQRGPIQESSGLGRRLTHAMDPMVCFFLITVHSLLLQRIAYFLIKKKSLFTI